MFHSGRYFPLQLLRLATSMDHLSLLQPLFDAHRSQVVDDEYLLALIRIDRPTAIHSLLADMYSGNGLPRGHVLDAMLVATCRANECHQTLELLRLTWQARKIYVAL